MSRLLKGFPFNINFFILLALIIFTFAYCMITSVIIKDICFIIVVISAILAIGPAFYRTVYSNIEGILKIGRELIGLFRFKIEYDLGIRRGELIYQTETLRKAMGIEKTIGFKIIPDFKNACVFWNNISLGKPLLERLDQDEILFVIAHELGHIKIKGNSKKQFYIMFGWGIVICILMSCLYRLDSITSLINLLLFPFLIIGLVTLAIRFICWFNEYEADTLAIQHVNKEAAKSALEKIAKLRAQNIYWSCYTHPSVSSRISNIEGWTQTTRHKKWYYSLN